jgi:hypothetical protein
MAGLVEGICEKIDKLAAKLGRWSVGNELLPDFKAAKGSLDNVVSRLDALPDTYKPAGGNVVIGDTVEIKGKFRDVYAAVVDADKLTVVDVKGAFIVARATKDGPAVALGRKHVAVVSPAPAA